MLDFNAFDAWYEEDERVLGHPRDPFSRIDVRRTSRPVRIELDGEVLAESTHARMLFETGIHTRFYVPKEDVRGELPPATERSYCPYKGEASYWTFARPRGHRLELRAPAPGRPADRRASSPSGTTASTCSSTASAAPGRNPPSRPRCAPSSGWATGRVAPMGDHPELDARARRVIDANHYMTLGTVDPDGAPRLSPVYYTAARYRDFYWLSTPTAQHSRNVAGRPEVRIVIFGSTARVGEGEAVYLSATARAIADDELEAVCGEAFRSTAGAHAFTAEELRAHPDFRLYVAAAHACEVHVPGRDPVFGRGIDARLPAAP